MKPNEATKRSTAARFRLSICDQVLIPWSHEERWVLYVLTRSTHRLQGYGDAGGSDTLVTDACKSLLHGIGDIEPAHLPIVEDRSLAVLIAMLCLEGLLEKFCFVFVFEN